MRGFWLQYLFSDAVLRIWVLYPCFWYVLMISFMKVHIDTVPRMNVLPFFRFQDYVTSLIPIPIHPGLLLTQIATANQIILSEGFLGGLGLHQF